MIRLQSDYKYVQQNKSSEHWTLENGYTKDASIDSFPVRVLGAGAGAGLLIYLNSNKTDVDFICSGLSQGFKVNININNCLKKSCYTFLLDPSSHTWRNAPSFKTIF